VIADRNTLHLQPHTYYSLIEAQVSSFRSPKMNNNFSYPSLRGVYPAREGRVRPSLSFVLVLSEGMFT
jgi:hypothetical protein